jgi:DNA-binding LacI/PurR family transcriptional regulator
MACGCIDTARHEFKRRLPEDLCILGFDDIAQASWAGYDLTTFAQPYGEIAQAVVQSLAIQPNVQNSKIMLYARPVWRSTMRS